MYKIERAKEDDLEEILMLQKLAYQSEAKIYNDNKIPPLLDTMDDIRAEFGTKVFLKLIDNGTITGSVRAFEKDGICYIGKLFVHPLKRNTGMGRALMEHIENCFVDCGFYELFTGHLSKSNIRFYYSLGYKTFRTEKVNDSLNMIFMKKCNKHSLLK